jgi:fermentation-respiration switch protein FrsA (DUF1100 family)
MHTLTFQLRLLGALLLLLWGPRVRAETPPAPAALSHRVVEGPGFSGHVITASLLRTRVQLLGASNGGRVTVKELVAALPRVAATNASFFDEKDHAIGVWVDARVAHATRPQRGWGALVIRDGKASIVESVSLTPMPELVVQGLPRLVVGGVAQHLKTQFARRTAVCADGDTLRLVVTTLVEANAFARWLATVVGCRDALNLDGGPSTQLELRLPDAQLSEPGQPVPNALVLTPR